MAESPQGALPTPAPAGIVTSRYVRIGGKLYWVAEYLTGLTTKAMQQKIDDGVWVQDQEWVKAPDGNRYLYIPGYENWVARGCPDK